MIIILQVKAPLYMAQAIKETLAMSVERFGDTKVLEIRPDTTEHIEQMKMN